MKMVRSAPPSVSVASSSTTARRPAALTTVRGRRLSNQKYFYHMWEECQAAYPCSESGSSSQLQSVLSSWDCDATAGTQKVCDFFNHARFPKCDDLAYNPDTCSSTLTEKMDDIFVTSSRTDSASKTSWSPMKTTWAEKKGSVAANR